MRRSLALLGLMLLAAVSLRAQSLTVQYQQELSVQVPGATAAYAVNSLYAEATASEGVVTIYGKNPGTTSILVVTGVGVQTMSVTVPQPAPAYPPGFEPPIPERRLAENGSYELRYNTDPGQLQNTFEFRRSQGDRTVRFRVSNVNYVQGDVGAGQSRIGLAHLSYDILTPQRQITFADQQVINSPLTLDNVLLRGLHWREGSWSFHGGYASLASFQNLFLPAQREAAVGVAYRFRLSDQLSLSPNLFYFDTDSRVGQVARSGAMLSMVLQSAPRTGWEWLAELGVGRGAAFAAAINYQGQERQALRARFRYEPKDFASLSLNNLHGLLSDLQWQYQSGRWTSSFNSSTNRYLLPTGAQSNLSNNWSVQAKLGQSWAALSGLSVAHFSAPSLKESRESATSLQFPVGLSYNRTHYGLTAQYRYSYTDGAGAGHGVRLAARSGWNGWQLGAYLDRQTQVATLSTILSDTPGLQDLLDRLGIAATSPQQVSELLRNSAVLEALGFVNGYGLNISPVNLQAGSDLSWSQRGGSRQQVNFSFLYNNNETLHGGAKAFIYSGSYTRKLGQTNEIFGSVSVFRSSSLGAGAENHPVLQFGLRHSFATVPSWIVPGRTGSISGHVFEDAHGEGRFSPSTSPLAEVELLLDGTRRTRTDERGRYSFSRVPYGDHRVEVLYRSDRPFYFTTLSRQNVAVDGTADFGITYSLGQLIGYVRSDAGLGIPGISVRIEGPSDSRHAAITNDEGKFTMASLAPGLYRASLVVDTVPPGYQLSNIEARSAEVRPAHASEVAFILVALRSIAGRLEYLDGNRNRVPFAGAQVELLERNVKTQSDPEGFFMFRDLPPGKYTIRVSSGGKQYRREVDLPAGPWSSKGNDFLVEDAPAPAPSGDVSGESSQISPIADSIASEDTMRDVFFDFGRYSIRPDQVAAIDETVRFLQRHPDVLATIAGHCDARGSAEFNRSLGSERAQIIRQAFVARGIKAERLRAVSYGSERPFCVEPTPGCWSSNRRVHITLDKQ